MAKCADRVKRVTLELGGKSPNVVFADADLEAAAAAAPMSFLDNSGQDCCARTRILVQRGAHDRFLELLAPPSRRSSSATPPTSAPRWARSSPAPSSTASAPTSPTPSKGSGARRPRAPASGSRRPSSPACPRTPPAPSTRFGPVAVVLPFEDEADAIRLANATEYGLSGSIWTRDVGRALRVSRAVRAGNLSVNSHSSVRYWTPFGGYQQSGLGRELGPDALTAFTETKNVFISTEA